MGEGEVCSVECEMCNYICVILSEFISTLFAMESYFFIGVAGVGMSAIAQYLVGKGVSISGSDRQFGEFLAGKTEKPLVMGQLE